MGSDAEVLATGVKAVVEATLEPFSDLIRKIAGPAAIEVGLALRDHIRVVRYERYVRLLKRVDEFLKEENIEPQAVPLKLLTPIIEAASLEEDNEFQDKWAMLLANSAAGRDVHPAYPEILRQLSTGDALYLHLAFEYVVQHYVGPTSISQKLDPVMSEWHSAVGVRGLFKGSNGIYPTPTDNLIRLGLLIRKPYDPNIEDTSAEHFHLTTLGFNFLLACEDRTKYDKAVVRVDRRA